MTLQELVGETIELLDLVFENLSSIGIDITNREIDHFAYRAESKEEYEKLCKQIVDQNIGALIGTIVIRERPISNFKLSKPLIYKHYTIPCLEILSPAEGEKPYKRKLEHIEIIVDEMSLSDFMQKYPDVEFNTSGLDRKINPELKLMFDNGANAKFHPMSIEKVIEIENAL